MRGGASADSSRCVDCEAGKASQTTGATEEAMCQICYTGTISGPGSAQCTGCSAGKYANADKTSCKPCKSGTYSGPSASLCSSCPGGKFSGSMGATACNECATGAFSSAGSSVCDVNLCPPGNYESAGNPCQPCCILHNSRLLCQWARATRLSLCRHNNNVLNIDL